MGLHESGRKRRDEDQRGDIRPPLECVNTSHVWMAPDLQEFFRVMNSGRLQSCVRPFSAVLHDRWP